MKIVNESIFRSSLRAFLHAFFAIFGVGIALLLFCVFLYGVVYVEEEETYSSDVKILPDQNFERKKLGNSAPVFLQINIDGEIGKDELTAKKIEKMLLKTREGNLKEDRIKGILLSINSPGGEPMTQIKFIASLLIIKKDSKFPFLLLSMGCARLADT